MSGPGPPADGRDAVQGAIRELQERLGECPVDRFPIEHATFRHRLGVALAGEGRLAEAAEMLDVAAELLSPERFPKEHGTSVNALGAVLRSLDRLQEAETCFRRAEEVFRRAGSRLERGAALYNLGLVRRQARDAAGALESLEEARRLLDPTRVPVQAASALRELGEVLLETGDVEDARRVLEDAVEAAGRAGDRAGAGAAANALGLAELALGVPEGAVGAFRTATIFHPRSVRPEAYAMAKANLALAYERASRIVQARLAARQAVGVPSPPFAVREQAREILDRLGEEPGDLLRMLDEEPSEEWPGVVRAELARWTDAGSQDLAAEARAWVQGQLAREERGGDVAEALLAGVLEVPPEAMERLVRALVDAVAAQSVEDVEAFGRQLSSGMIRFPGPQWMRLRDTFGRIASEVGLEVMWH